jgi:hypothetical protein
MEVKTACPANGAEILGNELGVAMRLGLSQIIA